MLELHLQTLEPLLVNFVSAVGPNFAHDTLLPGSVADKDLHGVQHLQWDCLVGVSTTDTHGCGVAVGPRHLAHNAIRSELAVGEVSP